MIPCPHCRRQAILLKEIKQDAATPVKDSYQMPGGWNEGVTYGAWIQDLRTKPIEDRIHGLSDFVWYAGIILAICLVIAGLSMEETSAKVLGIAGAAAMMFSGWVWMLLLQGFAELIRLTRAKK